MAIIIDGVDVTGDVCEAEAREYLKRAPRGTIKMDVELDGDWANIWYTEAPVPFERIRRITGYLVGDMGRFNDAKLAEVNDRVKHSVEGVE